MEKKQELLNLIDILSTAMKQHQLSEIEASINGISAKLCSYITPASPSTHHTESHPIETYSSDTMVLSPTIGTFYAKASPQDKDFVGLQSHVQKGQTVGLLESMKVFYPIHAPCSGIITHIYIEHGHSAEYHQPLMSIKPDQS